MVLSERFLYTLTKYISVMLLELYHITSFQIFIEKSRLYPVGTGHKGSNRRRMIRVALVGTRTWRTIKDKSRIFLKIKTCFFAVFAVYYGKALYLRTINFGGFEKHKLLNCLL